MSKLMILEIGLVLLLVLAAIFVRGGLLRDSGDKLETPPTSQTSQTTAPTADTTPTTPPVTDPTGPSEPAFSVVPNQPAVEVTAANAFVYDPNSNEVTYLKGDLDGKLYPASITKLFSAYVALQNLDPDTEITAGNELELVAKDASIAYIKKGHRLTVRMLIQGMMLPSGNDAAYVLAAGVGRAISGNANMQGADAVACFVEAMNESAAALGLTGSHFCNPDGYHDADHYTSARDLMQIARMAMEDPIISEYTAMAQANVRYASGETNTWTNTNLLLQTDSDFYCEDAIGLKTGRTGVAGWCLMSAFRTEDGYVIAGVFGCPEDADRFTDTLKLYNKVIRQN